jgi:hypothetical protein
MFVHTIMQGARAIYPRAFQRRFSVNLWGGLVEDSVVSQDCKK